MSSILTFPWTRQPQRAVRVNPRFKPSLKFLVTGTSPLDLSNSGYLLTPQNGAVIQAEIPGLGFASDASSSSMGWTTTSNFTVADNGTEITLFWLFKSNNATQDKSLFGHWGSTPTTWKFLISTDIPGKISVVLNKNNGGVEAWLGRTTTNAIVANKWYSVVATWKQNDGDGLRFFIDGVYDAGVTFIGDNEAGLIRTATNALSLLNRGGDLSYAYNGSIALMGVFEKKINNADAKYLSANPWQIFQPDTLDLWIPAAAGGSETVTPSAGALTLSGLAPTLSLTEHKTVTPSVGALTIAGLAPTLSVSGNKVVTPDVASLAITGLAPTLSLTANQWITTGVGALSITGNAPTVSTTANQWVTAGVGAITITGYAPTVNRTEHQWIATGVGSMTLSGLAPTISVSAEGVVQPGFGALTLTGYAPTVQRTEHHWITTGLGALTLTGNAPTLDSGIKVGLGALTLTGLAPTISVSDLKIVTPSVGALTITGYAPVVFSPITITPTAAELTITGYAPTLTSANILPGIAELELTGYAPTLAINGWFDVTAATDTWIDVSAASDTWTNI